MKSARARRCRHPPGTMKLQRGGISPRPTRIRASRSPGRRESRCRILSQTGTLTVSLGGLFLGRWRHPLLLPSFWRALLPPGPPMGSASPAAPLPWPPPARRRAAPGAAQDQGAGSSSPSAPVNRVPVHTRVQELSPGTAGSHWHRAVTASPVTFGEGGKKQPEKELSSCSVRLAPVLGVGCLCE